MMFYNKHFHVISQDSKNSLKEREREENSFVDMIASSMDYIAGHNLLKSAFLQSNIYYIVSKGKTRKTSVATSGNSLEEVENKPLI